MATGKTSLPTVREADLASKSSKDGIFGPPFLYDPSEYALTFIFKWNATIMPLVLSSPLFYFLMFAHALNLSVFHFLDGHEPLLDWRAAVIPSSLLTFLLVSFGNQCYARYFQLYTHCVGLHGSIMEWTALIKLEFGHKNAAFQWNVLRLLLGALQVHYALLGGDDIDSVTGDRVKGVSDDEWRAIRTRNLLSRDEVERMKAFAGFKPFLPVGWALAEVKGGLLNTDASSAATASLEDNMSLRMVFGAFRGVAFKFREHSSATFNLLNAPVPFAYFHAMKLLLLLSLLIISYALVELLEGQVVLATIVYGLTCLVMVGLSEIAISMSDPFGEDQADFNLEAFLESVYNNAVGYLCDDRTLALPHGLPEGMENPLEVERLRVWGSDGQGLMDRRETPRGQQQGQQPAQPWGLQRPPPPHGAAPSAAGVVLLPTPKAQLSAAAAGSTSNEEVAPPSTTEQQSGGTEAAAVSVGAGAADDGRPPQAQAQQPGAPPPTAQPGAGASPAKPTKGGAAAAATAASKAVGHAGAGGASPPKRAAGGATQQRASPVAGGRASSPTKKGKGSTAMV